MSLRGKKDKDKKDKNTKEEPKKVEQPTSNGSPTTQSATRNWKKRLDENNETNRYNSLNSMIILQLS